ncbi:uncharacterized protein LOC109710380 isoform X1 [Ananas comosus]|uniref:Uncharacterized protein LOC109710380 isoform X1 n=1 Tax=Ananas comosus TaxID=4615 RepID=A0A6P5EYA9_ANACO|nr:uncharacterized protein LOC109710380 isoform X1 [Ananas comosus]
MAAYRVAAVIKNPSDEDEFLVVRQSPPPPLQEEEYGRYVDSDLWDLPSAPLTPLAGDRRSDAAAVEGADSVSEKLDLAKFDLGSALHQVLMQVGPIIAINGKWVLLKYVEEAEFGPERFVNTLFVLGSIENKGDPLQETCKWMSNECALKLLLEVKPCASRLGPLVVSGLLTHSVVPSNLTDATMLPCQEYPPGITLVPMKSRTTVPFRTTNLVIVHPDKAVNALSDSSFVTSGDTLIMDPGCCSQFHKKLADLVASLPRKLVVFVTHHHYDHIDGLSVVQRCNPDAILLAHENTMNRIGKGNWSRGYIKITGGEKICIGGQQLEVISAPGHTDGHLALLHISTNSLIVGDHCVGQGSALLDFTAGGNMKDYFNTTYKFLDTSPHVLIPMHGRINLWPKRMLCGYLKHRRDREASILKVIEDGAETLSDIIGKSYGDIDIKLWIPASSNVRLHVDHLAYQQKLPKDFSMKKFRASCTFHFAFQFIWRYMKTKMSATMLVAVGVAGLAIAYAMRKKFNA